MRRLSAIINTKGRYDFFKKALRSIISQTDPNQELREIIIIENDNKTLTYWKKFFFIKWVSMMTNIPIIYRNIPNKSLGECRHIAVTMSTGDWFTFLDDDDYWHPDYIKILMNVITPETDIVVNHSKKEFVNHIGYGVLDQNITWLNEKLQLVPDFNQWVDHLPYKYYTECCCKIYRRAIYDRLPIKFQHNIYEDVVVTLGYLINSKELSRVTDHLYIHTSHASDRLTSQSDIDRQVKATKEIYPQLIDAYPGYESLIAEYYRFHLQGIHNYYGPSVIEPLAMFTTRYMSNFAVNRNKFLNDTGNLLKTI